MQLTGKDNYTAFNSFYNSNYSNSTNFISSPNQINSSSATSLISALWFFKTRALDKISINSNTSIDRVSLIVNGGTNGLPERRKVYKTLQSYINCNQ
jgi:predicted chitinase